MKGFHVRRYKSKIKKIVADHLGIEEEKVTEEASFIDDLGADSLDTVELVMAFEENWFRDFNASRKNFDWRCD